MRKKRYAEIKSTGRWEKGFAPRPMKTRIILPGILVVILAATILVTAKPWLSPSEKLLQKYLGAYRVEEKIQDGDTLAHPAPIDPGDSGNSDSVSEYLIQLCPDYYARLLSENGDSFDDYWIQFSPTYTLKEIDEEFWHNGILEQGTALQQKLIPNREAFDSIKDKYVLIVNYSEEFAQLNRDPGTAESRHAQGDTYFFIDGDAYCSAPTGMSKMKKVSPPKIKGSSLHNLRDPILKKCMGEYSYSEDVWDNMPFSGWGDFAQARDLRVVLRSECYAHQEINIISPGIYHQFRTRQSPEYRVQAIDEAYYKNGVRHQGAALHQIIPTADDLESYREKYAITIELPPDSTSNYENPTFFYLDGAMYYSESRKSLLSELPNGYVYRMERIK